MNFDSLKLDYLGHRIQVIFFDRNGAILHSCNTIESFDEGSNIYNQIIFLESIQEQLIVLKEPDQLNFHCINDIFGNGGTYDFGFEIHTEGDQTGILWSVCDFSFQYQQLINLQQSRNDNVIHKERLSQLNKRLTLEKELLKEQTEADSSDQADSVFLKLDSLLVNFKIKDICLAEAYGDYVKVHTSDGKMNVIYSTFKKVEEKLPKTDFARVHRSFLVRLDRIQNIDTNNLIINDKVVPVSQKYRNDFMDKIKTL